MLTFFRVMASRVRGFLRPDEFDRELTEELKAHLTMAEEDKIRQGMSREEARRVARVELGGLTQLRESARDANGLPWLDTCWLDAKLGLRMLKKSWGLTLVGGLAMTLAIGAGAVVFAVFDMVFSATLPLDEGDRVVVLQTWDEQAGQRRSTSRADFERWRDSLRSVEDVGAFQMTERNLLLNADGPFEGTRAAESVTIAEMTASGFQLARVAPLLGRPLLAEDEHPRAGPVVVIGYDVWQSRFAADPAVVGRMIRLDAMIHTVVGVMPEGFEFPVNHQFWTPLLAERSQEIRGDGFGAVFARLVPGATMERAQAEMTALGLSPSGDQGGETRLIEENEDLTPRLVAYPLAFIGDNDRGETLWMIRLILFVAVLLLIPPCANIAILIYARTIMRQEEFVARYVLGASRGRIVGQIFIEVLVLAAAAAAAALVFTRFALGQIHRLQPEMPFWFDFTLSIRTVLIAAGLAVVAALIAGAVPAMKATGSQMQSGLRALGSRTSPQLGATWTVLVVVQVAFSMAALPLAVELGWGTIREGVLGPGFATEEFLSTRIETSAETRDELVRQLRAEPTVLGVSVTTAVPGGEPWTDVEVEGMPLDEDRILSGNHLVRFNHVDDVFFDVFDVPFLIGGPFPAGENEPTRAVIVNQTFAKQLLSDGNNPLGRRIRQVSVVTDGGHEKVESEVWYEVVGVVADLPAPASRGTLYFPLAPGQTAAASILMRGGPTTASMANGLREIATALDPTLRLQNVLALEEIYRQKQVGNNVGASTIVAVMVALLLLSAAGIYALMSFTVSQRRREVGIRAALGAQPRHLVAGIFRRSLGQVAAGAFAGLLAALVLDYFVPVEEVGGWSVPGVIPLATALMMAIGLFATTGPARRGLRVDPIEELREG